MFSRLFVFNVGLQLRWSSSPRLNEKQSLIFLQAIFVMVSSRHWKRSWELFLFTIAHKKKENNLSSTSILEWLEPDNCITIDVWTSYWLLDKYPNFTLMWITLGWIIGLYTILCRRNMMKSTPKCGEYVCGKFPSLHPSFEHTVEAFRVVFLNWPLQLYSRLRQKKISGLVKSSWPLRRAVSRKSKDDTEILSRFSASKSQRELAHCHWVQNSSNFHFARAFHSKMMETWS